MTVYQTTPQCSSCAEIHRSNGAIVSVPPDFDPASCPIIARHFFGIEPFRSIGEVAAEVVADLRFEQQVKRLHALGPRVVAELFAEIAAERSIMTLGRS